MLKPLFLDTEFTGLHQNTTLISLAIVGESGEEFYAEFTDYAPSQVSPWIEENVVQNLFLQKTEINGKKVYIKDTKENIVLYLQNWFSQFNTDLQIWADVPHYDWVLFCELFGGALHIPKQIHYMCMDLATVFQVKGYSPDYERTQFLAEHQQKIEGTQHNALYDTLVCKKCFEILIEK